MDEKKFKWDMEEPSTYSPAQEAKDQMDEMNKTLKTICWIVFIVGLYLVFK